MDYREFSAKTLDEAITEASIGFGVPSSELDYEIIEKGSAGILGFGKKDLTIKAWKKADETAEVKAEERIEDRVVEPVSTFHEEPVHETVQEVVEPLKTETYSHNSYEDSYEHHSFDYQKKDAAPVDVDLVTSTARDFLKELFATMGMEVQADIQFSNRDNSLSIDLSGDNMGIIIGKRGQTLDSLQYIVNLVVNKKTETYVRIKLDTEDYRRRRRETLENLAKNIAFKVRKSGVPVTLEAMNPYERRTIHYALQRDRYVSTYSEGDEPFRHVVVAPKN